MASKQELSNCEATLASERLRERQRVRGQERACLFFPVCYSSPSLDDVAELGPFIDSHSVISAEHCDSYISFCLCLVVMDCDRVKAFWR